MPFRNQTISHLLALSSFLLINCIFAHAEEAESPRRRTCDSQSTIHFYGKLVDQKDNPVKGAKIIYEIEKYGLFFPSVGRRSVKRGKDGRFKIRGGNAAKLRILDAILDGYEYLWIENDSSFEYRTFYNDDIRHDPDKNHPVILHIRKREAECCYVLKREYQYRFNPEKQDKRIGIDLFSAHDSIKHPDDAASKAWDLEISAQNDPDNNQWILTFKTNGEKSGIQNAAKELYMAPEDGYGQEVSLSIKYSRNSHDYSRMFALFVRTDNPTAYLRIDLGYTSSGDGLRINFNSFMNPYGERLLESVKPFRDWQDEYTLNLLKIKKHQEKGSAGYAIYSPIEEDARKAIHNRKLAEKPDISKPLKEGILMFEDRRHY